MTTNNNNSSGEMYLLGRTLHVALYVEHVLIFLMLSPSYSFEYIIPCESTFVTFSLQIKKIGLKTFNNFSNSLETANLLSKEHTDMFMKDKHIIF